MTQDEIIEMARQAGISEDHARGMTLFLEAFAKLVAQHERERLTDAAMKAAEKAVDVAMALEREACAKLADKYMERWTAEAIRARGQA